MKRVLLPLLFLLLWTGSASAAETKPQRIVSLTLGTDEILLSLVPSKRILAVTAYALDPNISNVPELAKTIPNAMREASVEVIVALQPDLILAASYTSPDVLTQLKEIGMPILILAHFSSIEGIKTNIRALGQAVHENEGAEALIAQMEKRLRAVEKAIASSPDRPGLLSYDLDGWTAGRDTTFDEIVRHAGGRNLAAEAGLKGHPKISLEKVVALDPEILILNQWHLDKTDRNDRLLSHPALQSVSALKKGQVFEIPGKELTAVSHFIVKGVEEMARKLHPARFTEISLTP